MKFFTVKHSVSLAVFLSAITVFARDSDLLDLPDFNSKNRIRGAQLPSSDQDSWLGFGGNIYNNHWAGGNATADTDNIGTLKSVCQKTYQSGISAAPLVENGIAYFPTWGGLLVALNYQTCAILWELNITSLILQENSTITADLGTPVSRTTPVTDGAVLYIGTLARALVVAIEKSTGRVISTLSLSTHPSSILTQSPTIYAGALFIGLSTTESGGPALLPNYTFSHHGIMHALTLRDNQLTRLWTTPMIPPGSNYSGASIWGSQPSIDATRSQVFIGTGQLFSVPPAIEACQTANKNLSANTQHLVREPCMPVDVYQTSILALDIATGEINWATTLGPLDAWNAACGTGLVPGSEPNGPNCPRNVGDDADFGMAPTFVGGAWGDTPGGKDVVVAGQKNGNLYAFNAVTGRVLWGRNVVPGGTEGGLSWGIAVDDRAVYYTGQNSNRRGFTLLSGEVVSNSIFGAVRLRDGELLWQTAAPRNTSSRVAPTVVNDVVLTGITGNFSEGNANPVGSGSFLALNKRTGDILSELPLNASFRGNFAVVQDCVLFGTGYGRSGAEDNGTFNVWQVEHGGDSTMGPEFKQEARKSESERFQAKVSKGIMDLETEIRRLQELWSN
jgi:outer membrane protein assembly factor BamB